MGVGHSDSGMIFVADQDRIEKSNLSRQFLFRASDVGKPKAVCAADALKDINPNINVTSYELK